MMKILLFLLVSLGLSTEWGTSFSVRTPNDNTHPLDYEVSVKLEDTDGKFKYLLKRDWERELGEKYIDDVVKIQHQVLGYLYYGIDYVNKESKSIDYTTYNIGATINYFKALKAGKTYTPPGTNKTVDQYLKEYREARDNYSKGGKFKVKKRRKLKVLKN